MRLFRDRRLDATAAALSRREPGGERRLLEPLGRALDGANTEINDRLSLPLEHLERMRAQTRATAQPFDPIDTLALAPKRSHRTCLEVEQ